METAKKEFKGTEGNWNLINMNRIENDNGNIIVVILDTDNKNGQGIIPTTEANAKLIAAAPLLLAACQEFVRKVECGEAKSKRSYEQMKSAISSALGE